MNFENNVLLKNNFTERISQNFQDLTGLREKKRTLKTTGYFEAKSGHIEGVTKRNEF